MEHNKARYQLEADITNAAVAPLRRGFRMDLHELLGTLYKSAGEGGADASHVLFMNVHHAHDKEYYAKLSENDVLKTLVENAVTDVFLELPRNRQGIVDEFNALAGAGDKKHAYERFVEDFRTNRTETPYDDIIKPGYKKGQETEDARHYIREVVAPLIERVKRYGMEAHLTDDSRGSQEYWKYKSVCDKTSGAECIQAKGDYLNARLDDAALAAFVDMKTKGGKAFISGGALHGARPDDLDEYLSKGEDRRVFRIDSAPNFEIYAQKYGLGILNQARSCAEGFGDDPPDLVFLIKDNMFLTTSNTPQYVLDAIEKTGTEFMPIDKMLSKNIAKEEGQEYKAQENQEIAGISPPVRGFS